MPHVPAGSPVTVAMHAAGAMRMLPTGEVTTVPLSARQQVRGGNAEGAAARRRVTMGAGDLSAGEGGGAGQALGASGRCHPTHRVALRDKEGTGLCSIH